ncbi:MAG: DUF4931 domain-containing protein [Candidatus Moraniibacteriota bacterium]
MRILDPNRAQYTRSFRDKNRGACVFCKKDETLEIHSLKNKYWRIIANRFPYMDGNVMLIPNRHIETLEEITATEWRHFSQLLLKTKRTLEKVFKTESFNIGMNLGPESGASIAHIHWQIIPRTFKNITVMNTLADLHIVSIPPEETRKRIEDTIAQEGVSKKS